MRVAINGFGRIGRLIFRVLHQRGIPVVAINDLTPGDQLVYLLKHDTVHGPAPFAVRWDGTHMVVGDRRIRILSQREPLRLEWSEVRADVVIEATGLFTTADAARKHCRGTVTKVLVTAPSKDIPMFVMGVNDDEYAGEALVSNASCTTNCLAPLVKLLDQTVGIEEGLMTTIHATTSTQNTVDGPSRKNFRIGRNALQNIIPTSTGAAAAVGKVYPAVLGKLTGMAFRVPVANVSVVDLTVRTTLPTTLDKIMTCIRDSDAFQRGVLGVTDDPVVSSDCIGASESCIVDNGACIALNDKFFKLVAWYDNEWGYSNRAVDLLQRIMAP